MSKKRGRGRPAHEPTEESKRIVKQLAAIGTPIKSICQIIQIDDNTLLKHYRYELDTAAIQANAQVAASLFNQAIGGNVLACMFWLKTRARWRTDESEERQKNRAKVLMVKSDNNILELSDTEEPEVLDAEEG